MTDQSQVLDPQQDVTIESIIAQQAPGKDSEASANALAASLESMNSADLLSLVEQAYREDPESNSVVVQKASEILSQRGETKQLKQKMQSLRSESWRDLLGEWLGGELHGLLADQTNEEALMEHGQKALESALDAVGDLDDFGLDKGGNEAIAKLAEQLAKDAVAQSEEFLESDKGRSLLGKISRWVDDNPGYVLAMAVLAAAGVVAADVDLPELEQKFKFGKGFSGSVGAELGSIRHIALEAVKLDMQYVRGQFKVGGGVNYDSEKGTSGNASVRYGDKDSFVQTSGAIDPDGNLVVGLNAALKKGLFSGSIEGEQDFGKETQSAKINLRYGNDEQFISSGLDLNTEGALTTRIDSKYTEGLFSSSLTGQHQTENDTYSLGNSLRYGSETDFLQMDTNLSQDGLGGSLFGERMLSDHQRLDGRFDYDQDGLSSEFGNTTLFDGGSARSYLGTGTEGIYSGFDLGYQVPGLDLSLSGRDQGRDGSLDTVSAELGLKPTDVSQIVLKFGQDNEGKVTGSAEAMYEDKDLSSRLGVSHDGTNTRVGGGISYKRGDWNASAEADYNITEAQLEGLSLSLGFRDPEEFRAFSVEYAQSVNEGITEHELNAMFETQLGSFMLRGQGGARFTQDNVQLNAGLLGAHHLDQKKNWALIAGGQVNYDDLSGNTSFTPQVGVQYKNIPVTVGYDLDNKAVTVGITIPFGR